MLSQSHMVSIKYVCDRLFAAALLALLSPLLGAISLAVKLDSSGPVLFYQRRVGLRGRLFTLVKFRTMVDRADNLLDQEGKPIGNRVTRVGKLLRKTSLDELPQIVNVLLGQMSFIGPRPGLQERHEALSARQQRRCDMKPGITGLAQVSGRNTLQWSRRIEFDLEYIHNYSWKLDFVILWRTLRVVLTSEGVVLDRNPQQVDDIRTTSVTTSSPNTHVSNSVPFRRIEPTLVGHYRKDTTFEDALRVLNGSLAAVYDHGLQDIPEKLPTIHVIGAPRSGTTLLTQLISSCLNVGYINNLIAAFWRAPCYGIRLSEKLLPGVRPSSFRSDFGRTSSISEPHEFGYFWTHLLGYPEMAEQSSSFEQEIDWPRVRKVITNVSHTFGRPVVFKSFLLAWHLRRMQKELPRSLFIWIRRDPIDNALSILKARQSQLGSVEKWISMKPKEFSWLRFENPAVQVAGQVYFVDRAIARQAATLHQTNILEVSYEQMCSHPQDLIDRVNSAIQALGAEVKQINTVPLLTPAKLSAEETLSSHQISRALEAFAKDEYIESKCAG